MTRVGGLACAEGSPVDVRIDYGAELDASKVDEPTLWNSVTSLMIVMNACLARTERWLWMNTGSTENGNAILVVSDTGHPVISVGAEKIYGQ